MPYTFDAAATAQFEEYLDTAESLGLYVQYDMRNSFLNLPSVDYQVKYLRNDPISSIGTPVMNLMERITI